MKSRGGSEGDLSLSLELVRHSFSPNLVQAAGFQEGRADLYARLVGRVPVRRLLYPSGFEHLPRVVETIFLDLGRIV